MIRFNNNRQQQQLFDPWNHISPKRRQRLDQSWSGLFNKHVLSKLPVNDFARFFKSDFGRPTKDLYTVMGALILQQMHDLTDEETVDQLAFNIQWHYALNIIEESDAAKYLCSKTLWNMRHIMIENHLEQILFTVGTQNLAEVFNVDTEKQRIDSVHIRSNMRRLGRINIFSTAIHKFLKNLKRQHVSLFNCIEKDVIERYLCEKSLSCFAMIKPSQSHKTLQQVSTDLYNLINQFENHKDVQPMNSFKLLRRILDEQCTVEHSGDDNPVTVKEPKQIPSDSLQNPSDPDASYSGHKGQGYQVQIMETYTDTEDTDKKAITLNLITHVAVERAHESDANALIPAVESTQDNHFSPKQLLADSLYGSDENIQTAKSKGVEVIAPPMGNEKEGTFGLSNFHIESSGEVNSCPEGHAPIHNKKKKSRYCATFDIACCSNCPNQSICPTASGKKGFYLRFTEKQLRIALRRSAMNTDVFKNRYRWRAGIEATMSEFDRRTGVKNLRVRGLNAVRFSATIKAFALNILRAAAVMAAIFTNLFEKNGLKKAYYSRIDFFKEQYEGAYNFLSRLLVYTLSYMRIRSKMIFC